MKKLILSAALLLPSAAFAQPSSHVAWTADQLNFVKAGNPQKGEELAKTCSACHGEKGISASAAFPSLAGQLPTYLYKQLQDYADGSRDNAMMSGLAKTLSKQDAADLAVWFGSQAPAFQSRTVMVYEKAEKLVKSGSSERVLPPCEVCHGGDGKGQAVDIPALSGQNADYISATLKAFKDGTRRNDIYSRMRIIAQTLTDEEISELGYYYQNIKK
ncbi:MULTISPECIES: c-type cytochrome [Methylomonas]|uniref:Cytochrome C n=2 Tax=Methylomonas TaxID=416 RepID=A0A126T163_9GAMM|nr:MULTISPECIES: c-type cytochrome [Methylomonas]AMK75826.1 cytochrome C [Methylomonas denitrificans]OAH98581.1 cytochrome C [Methylomonas methanica]